MIHWWYFRGCWLSLSILSRPYWWWNTLYFILYVICWQKASIFWNLCIEVHNNKLRRVYVCIYKHPSVSDTHLSQMADRLLIICPDIVFLGDMNCCPKKSDAIKEFCELYNMKNLITSPTCHKGPSPTILDVIFISQPKRFTESLNCECPLSDFHNIIGGATKQYAPFEQPRKIYHRSYKNFDDDEFIHDINNAPFHVGEIFDDIDDLSWFTSSLLLMSSTIMPP